MQEIWLLFNQLKKKCSVTSEELNEKEIWRPSCSASSASWHSACGGETPLENRPDLVQDFTHLRKTAGSYHKGNTQDPLLLLYTETSLTHRASTPFLSQFS